MIATTYQPRYGSIASVENHGTIIRLRILDDDGLDFFVAFDHTPFRWLIEGEGCAVEGLLGREIGFDGETIWFLDEETR